MALIKEITLDNGVVINYHRVTSVMHITNNSTIIEVSSYTSKEKRLIEKTTTDGSDINVFINTKRYSIPYNSKMDVDSAYEYIKGLDEFKNAEND